VDVGVDFDLVGVDDVWRRFATGGAGVLDVEVWDEWDGDAAGAVFEGGGGGGGEADSRQPRADSRQPRADGDQYSGADSRRPAANGDVGGVSDDRSDGDADCKPISVVVVERKDLKRLGGGGG